MSVLLRGMIPPHGMSRRVLVISLLLALGAAVPARILSQAASPVTTPRQQFGANIGDDYFLATYTQLEQYWQTLDRESDRMRLVDIGATEEGRHQWMAVITAPENFAAPRPLPRHLPAPLAGRRSRR